MIIIPHNANSYMCLSTDLVYNPASGSSVVGLNEIGAFLFVTDTETQYVVLSDLSLSPLVYNIV